MGLASEQNLDQAAIRYFPVTVSVEPWTSQTNKVDRCQRAYTQSKSILLGAKDGNVSVAPGWRPVGPLVSTVAWGMPPAPYTWTSSAVDWEPVLHNSSTQSQQTIRSFSAAIQDYFWKDRIITTFGTRRDYTASRNSAPLQIDPATGLENPSYLQTFGSYLKASGTTKTTGVVVKPGGGLSFFINTSDNFTPATVKYDLFGAVLPEPTARGKDWGYGLIFSKQAHGQPELL